MGPLWYLKTIGPILTRQTPLGSKDREFKILGENTKFGNIRKHRLNTRDVITPKCFHRLSIRLIDFYNSQQLGTERATRSCNDCEACHSAPNRSETETEGVSGNGQSPTVALENGAAAVAAAVASEVSSCQPRGQSPASDGNCANPRSRSSTILKQRDTDGLQMGGEPSWKNRQRPADGRQAVRHIQRATLKLQGKYVKYGNVIHAASQFSQDLEYPIPLAATHPACH